MDFLGIDIGGSGIKGALVDLKKGELTTERHRIPTPQPAVPEAVADTVARVVSHFKYKGPVGCTFPAIIKDGVARSAANVDKAWIGTNAEKIFSERTGCPVKVLNDADAAAVAEMRYGVGEGQKGVVILLTFGTGIGSGMFLDGKLIPNSELGHVILHGDSAELWAASRVKDEEDLSWEEWASRVNTYLKHIELLFSPSLFILGGGVSNPKKIRHWVPLLDLQTPIKPAESGNNAGIIGAALAAKELEKKKKKKKKK